VAQWAAQKRTWKPVTSMFAPKLCEDSTVRH
jgi:hypothetical protein